MIYQHDGSLFNLYKNTIEYFTKNNMEYKCFIKINIEHKYLIRNNIGRKCTKQALSTKKQFSMYKLGVLHAT